MQQDGFGFEVFRQIPLGIDAELELPVAALPDQAVVCRQAVRILRQIQRVESFVAILEAQCRIELQQGLTDLGRGRQVRVRVESFALMILDATLEQCARAVVNIPCARVAERRAAGIDADVIGHLAYAIG